MSDAVNARVCIHRELSSNTNPDEKPVRAFITLDVKTWLWLYHQYFFEIMLPCLFNEYAHHTTATTRDPVVAHYKIYVCLIHVETFIKCVSQMSPTRLSPLLFFFFVFSIIYLVNEIFFFSLLLPL